MSSAARDGSGSLFTFQLYDFVVMNYEYLSIDKNERLRDEENREKEREKEKIRKS